MHQASTDHDRLLEKFVAEWEEHERSRHARLLSNLKRELRSDVPLSSLPSSTPKSEPEQEVPVASTPIPSRPVSRQVAPQKAVQASPRSQRRQFQEC